MIRNTIIDRSTLLYICDITQENNFTGTYQPSLIYTRTYQPLTYLYSYLPPLALSVLEPTNP